MYNRYIAIRNVEGNKKWECGIALASAFTAGAYKLVFFAHRTDLHATNETTDEGTSALINSGKTTKPLF